MLIAGSFWRKAVATLGAAVGFVFVYEATVRDSRYAARQATLVEAQEMPQPGTQLQFSATAYCKGTTTASGVGVRTGIAAADPALLPVGTVVRIETQNSRFDGIWTIMDTGPAIRGRIIDLYMWSCHEALAFGRRPIRLTVLRLGWNPQNSAPRLIDVLFRRREAEKRAAPPVTPPPTEPAPLNAVPVVPLIPQQPH
jgi:3D (Asp-Asp-Asp) domain-containing protein